MQSNTHKHRVRTAARRRSALPRTFGLLGIVPVQLARAVAVTSGRWRMPARRSAPRTRARLAA